MYISIFISFKENLFNDSAVTISVPRKSQQQVNSQTISTAMKCGWAWDIPLTNRTGNGYVYSSEYCSAEQAEFELREKLSLIGEDIEVRHLTMKVGRVEKHWHKNCVALGLSQGFVEPLEATGLLVFDATAKMLAEQFPSSKLDMPLIAKQFNERVTTSWDNVIDFVKAHYCLSKRDDSDFWLDNRASDSIPDSLKERLARWKHQPPSAYDFASKFDIFNLENYQYILYGMDFDTNLDNFQHRLAKDERASEEFAAIQNQAQFSLSKLPKHRDLIDKIYQYGLQKV